MSNSRALNANVIVIPEQREVKTASGLDKSSEVDKNEKWRQGRVVSFGNLCPIDSQTNESYVKIGDSIIYDKNKKTEFTEDDGVEYHVVYYADILKVK